jgi:hypothetical protein
MGRFSPGTLDSGVRRNEANTSSQTFYEIIKSLFLTEKDIIADKSLARLMSRMKMRPPFLNLHRPQFDLKANGCPPAAGRFYANRQPQMEFDAFFSNSEPADQGVRAGENSNYFYRAEMGSPHLESRSRRGELWMFI